MRRICCLLLALLTVLSCMSLPVYAEVQASAEVTKKVEPQIVTPTHETDDVIVAEIVLTEQNYGVDPTGVKDSTAAIQNALYDMLDQGGGVVYLPAGQYLVTNTVNVPSGVMLQGDWQDPDTTDAPTYGTVILARPNALTASELGNHDAGHLFRVTTNAGICGLTFYYPEQNLENPKPYGYTIYAHGFAFATVRDITMINSFRGIGASPRVGSSNHEMMQIERVRICALDEALRMSYSSEVGYTTDVRISPDYWANAGCGFAYGDAAKLRAYSKEHSLGMVLDRLDDETLSELYIDGVRTAMYMPSWESNSHFWGLIYDLTITDCTYGIVAEALSGIGQVIAKATIDADVKAIVNAAPSNGAMKLCDVKITGTGGISAEGGRIAYDDEIDLSDYEIKDASHFRPASILYTVDLSAYDRSVNDAAPVIQAALNRAASTGGIVYIPAGIYSIYSGLTVPAGVQLRGCAPMYVRDQSATIDVGTAFLTYVDDGASILLNQNAGVNGIRLFCFSYDPVRALSELQSASNATERNVGIKGAGSGVYAVNVGITATFIGIDFSDCDNHLVRNAFGCSYSVFARVGGENGLVENCLCNPSFIKRPHLWQYINPQAADEQGWLAYNNITENGSLIEASQNGELTPSQRWALLRDKVLRENAVMIEVTDATSQTVQNVFMYAANTLIRATNSSATLLNTSVDFLGWGAAYDISDNSDVLAVNALRICGKSVECDTTSSFDLYNRTAHSIYNEGDFHSSQGNVDHFEYTVTDKKYIYEESGNGAESRYPRAFVTTNSNPLYIKNGTTSLKHEGVGTSIGEAVIHVNMEKNKTNLANYMNGDGYLHIWLYVEDATSIVNGGNISLINKGGSGPRIRWECTGYVCNNGWIELMLPLHGLTAKDSNFDLSDPSLFEIIVNSNAFLEHGDIYVDDVYLCRATSEDECKLMAQTANPTANAPTSQSKPSYAYGLAQPPVEDPSLDTLNKIVISDCDSITAPNLLSFSSPMLTYAGDHVKQGNGAWSYLLTGTGTRVISQIKFSSVDVSSFMQRGYLHLWFYIEDASNLSGGYIELTSAGVCDQQEICWDITKRVKNDGWNEIVLPLDSPDGSFTNGGAFNPAAANFIRLYITSQEDTGTLYVLDDIYIAQEHVWNEGAVTLAPTHLVEGVKTYTCSECNETKTEPVEKLTECTFESWVKADENLHIGSCLCGKTTYGEHVWDDGVIAQAPTPTTSGTRLYSCQFCDATRTERTDKLDHPGSAAIVYTPDEGNTQLTVTDYRGTATNVIIPTRVDGLPVTALSSTAFGDRDGYDGDVSDGMVLPGDFLPSFGVKQITLLSKTIAIPDSPEAIPASITLCGYQNSTAQRYAAKYGRAFVLLPEIYSASVSLGSDITVSFSAYLGEEHADALMEFTMNGKTVTVSGVATATPNKYQFTFEGVSPHTLGDSITARLMLGEEELDIQVDYSVRQYCLRMKAKAEEKSLGLSDAQHAALATLTADILEYGAASQLYTSYRTDALVNEGVSGASEFVTLGEECKMPALQPTSREGYSFHSAKVELSNVVRLYFAIKAEDVSRVTVKIGNTTYGADDLVCAQSKDKQGNVITVWELRSAPIYADRFDRSCEVVLCVDGQACQTLSYSVVNYIYNVQNSTDNAALTALLKRIYCYGSSAKAYATAK